MLRQPLVILGTLLAIVVSGCGAEAAIDGRALADAVGTRLSITIDRERPPAGSPVLAGLRATYSGGENGESVTVLDFYSASSRDQALGGSTDGGPNLLVLRRGNVVVLYRHGTPGSPDRSAALRDLLADAPRTS